MAPVSRQGVPVLDFMGLVTNVGRIATEQTAMASSALINLTALAPGELSTRPGLRPVSFDEDEEDS